MTTILVKLPEALDQRLQMVAARKRTSKSTVIRQAVEQALRPNGRASSASCYELAKDLCGSVKGAPRDLSTNKRYLAGFGR
jgi:predicted DNA-binding protein